jgi:glutaredoxin
VTAAPIRARWFPPTAVAQVRVCMAWHCARVAPTLTRALLWTLAAVLALQPTLALAAAETALPTPTRPPHIEAFVREGCQHCEQAQAFLAQLQNEQPGLQVRVRDVGRDPEARARLEALALAQGSGAPRVPSIWAGGQLIVGYSTAARSDQAIRRALAGEPALSGSGSAPSETTSASAANGATSCTVEDELSCKLVRPDAQPEAFEIDLLGRTLTLDAVGLPLFALMMGLLSGFGPCALWVLLLMVSLLAALKDRRRMLVVAGSFVLVEGLSYFVLMTAWLNLFLAVGLSRASQWVVAGLAAVAGLINVKDFHAQGLGPTLSMPARAKPGIYERLRGLLHTPSLPAAAAGAAVLALLVQGVDLLCSSGLLALFTRVLTLHGTDRATTWGPMALYMAGYMGVHLSVLGVGVALLSRQRLQERQGRWLKLVSGLVMLGLSAYLALGLLGLLDPTH